MKLISKVLRMARVKGIAHTVLPATYTFIHEWNEPSSLYSQPQSIITLWPVLISSPTEGRKLSRPGWLVTYYRGGMPTRRLLPIVVPTNR